MARFVGNLAALVDPSSVALIGASDNPASIGGRALRNLLEFSDFRGRLYLINPARDEIQGQRSWPDVGSLPEVPELVMVAVPAKVAVPVLEQCGRLGVKFAIVFTSGFGEGGGEGLDLAERLKLLALETGMRIYGPNCPGVCNVNKRLGFTFSPSFPNDLRSGSIGLVTQGGGLGRNIMQSMDRGIGVGLWFSTGNELDLQVADFVHYLADAPDIKVIVMLLEGIKDGARFVSAVQYAQRQGKPMVVFKVGRSAYGQRAAQSHTASLTGSAEVNSAVFRQLGVIEVDDIDELADTAWLLARAEPPARPGGLAVYCSSGGTAALTADLIGVAGLTLTELSAETIRSLRCRLPGYAAIENPIDTTTAVLSDLSIVDETLLAVCRDPGVSLVVFPMSIDYGEVTERIARSIVAVQTRTSVPIVPIWMSERTGPAYRVFVEAGLAPIRSVGKAVKAIARWLEQGRWRTRGDEAFEPLLLKQPPPIPGPTYLLTEVAGKRWLKEFGIPIPDFSLATSSAHAVEQARRLGYPVVAKVVSPDVPHKSDAGGVRLSLDTDVAVAQAWEAIHADVRRACPKAKIEGVLIEPMAPADGFEVLVGVSRDPVLGHVMTVGMGGLYVELLRDVARRMLPVTSEQAYEMLRELRCFSLLKGARGQPASDLEALQNLLVTVSSFVVEHAQAIEEMDLNPVWVGREGQGVYPLDAIIVARRRAEHDD